MRHTSLVAVAAAALMTMTCVAVSDARSAAPSTPIAPGKTTGHQGYCFTMTPFEDELRLDLALVAPPTVGFYTIFAQWWGAGRYLIQGAGDGQVNHNRTRVSVSFVFFNHTEWASRNRWGRFAASIHLSTLKGPWTLSITGNGRPEGEGSGTPYSIQGFLVPKPCSEVGTVPPSDPPNLVLAPLE
jgi:hypothetical protein